MSDRKAREPEFDLDFEPLPAAAPASGSLSIRKSAAAPLTPAQVEFNKRMKALERARAAHDKERADLDRKLADHRKLVTPLMERGNRVEFAIIMAMYDAHYSLKLTKRRSEWLGDLISDKAGALLYQSSGLTGEETARLDALVNEFGPSFLEEEAEEEDRIDFEFMRGMVRDIAAKAGLDINLDDLEFDADPAETERKLRERLMAADEDFKRAAETSAKPAGKAKPRKPTKAAREREQQRQAIEEAKKRDAKTLYKQLAKVLHPDLEPDPTLKAHKEAWMKRLTSAHSSGDLHDMLMIELEWLGEEAGNLATASEEKLRTYALMLKEQTDELRERTRDIAMEPQYQPLHEFRGPFGAPVTVREIVGRLSADLREQEEALAILQAGGTGLRKLIHRWADDHADDCRRY